MDISPLDASARRRSAAKTLSWPVLAFILTAFGLSYAGQLAIFIRGGIDGPLFAPLAPILMFTPAAAAFVATRIETTGFRRLFQVRFRLVPFLAAIVVPTATALGAAFLIAASFGGDPSPWSVDSGSFILPDSSPFVWTGRLGPVSLIGNVLVTACVFSVVGGVLAIGEEIGWRGYLQPRLCRRLGVSIGLVAVGILWSLWHLPVLLMGYTFPDAPILGGFLLFPIIGIALSFFLGWLRLATGGIWAAVLAHGCYNGLFSTLVFTMDFGGHTIGAYVVIVVLTGLTGVAFVPLVRQSQ